MLPPMSKVILVALICVSAFTSGFAADFARSALTVVMVGRYLAVALPFPLDTKSDSVVYGGATAPIKFVGCCFHLQLPK